jgi:poly(3-hydroxybutyrate) depolymerase/surface polysaccharide O-acyltransferase-like enzyme
MRVLAVAGVIAVHVVSSTNRPEVVEAGALTVLLHTSREVFVTVTALVLTYRGGTAPERSRWRFWLRRYWLVGVPYLVWSGAYFLADGEPLNPPLSALSRLGLDLVTGAAHYHLYFLLVTMQIYLIVPLLSWLVKITRGRHRAVILASAFVQIVFSALIHYQVAVPPVLRAWLDHPDALLPSYQLYILTGAIMADHIADLSDWVRQRRLQVGLALLLIAAAGVSSYLIEVSLLGQPPQQASQVFQPVVTVESLAIVLGAYTLGAWWAETRRPGWVSNLIGDGSASSFGIYLAHPLVLQGVVTLSLVSGALEAMTVAPSAVVLTAGLLGIVPLVLAVTWGLVRLTRYSRLSMALTGRPTIHGWRVSAAGGTAAAALSVMVVASRWFPAGLTPPLAVDLTPGPIPTAPHLVAPLAGGWLAPSDARVTTQTIDMGPLHRSYQLIRPAHLGLQRLPVIVMLHGVGATVEEEEQRDGLLGLPRSGRAILVYPDGYNQSWNAGSCCGDAQRLNVDDVGFLTRVIRRVAAMPGADRNRISLVGYSNGGKMAYRLVCEEPRLVAMVAVVAALPSSDCRPGGLTSILVVVNRGDPALPSADVEREVASWRVRNHCRASFTTRTAGQLTLQRWARCRAARVVELATYADAAHSWPSDLPGTPSPAQVIWRFLNFQ